MTLYLQIISIFATLYLTYLSLRKDFEAARFIDNVEQDQEKTEAEIKKLEIEALKKVAEAKTARQRFIGAAILALITIVIQFISAEGARNAGKKIDSLQISNAKAAKKADAIIDSLSKQNNQLKAKLDTNFKNSIRVLDSTGQNLVTNIKNASLIIQQTVDGDGTPPQTKVFITKAYRSVTKKGISTTYFITAQVVNKSNFILRSVSFEFQYISDQSNWEFEKAITNPMDIGKHNTVVVDTKQFSTFKEISSTSEEFEFMYQLKWRTQREIQVVSATISPQGKIKYHLSTQLSRRKFPLIIVDSVINFNDKTADFDAVELMKKAKTH